MKRRKLFALLMVFTMAISVGCSGSKVSKETENQTEKSVEYLEEYFGIEPFEKTVSRDDFDYALLAIGGFPTWGEGELTVEEAVASAVAAAGMEELALSYSNEANETKATDSLKKAGASKVSEDYQDYVACAIDIGMVEPKAKFTRPLDGETATSLIMDAVEMSGQGRRYMGRVSDYDIYEKIANEWSSFANFDDQQLSVLGAALVIQEASTGFNLKYDGYNANFLPDYTLQYGHSDITHATQLLGLLRSEGIDAFVQLEPKVSIYEYMTDWGDPTEVEATPTYELHPIEGGRWLCYAMEYDMKLEFDNTEDKEAFHGIIEAYAKKYDDRVDEDGNVIAPLLYGSWWQPLYTSTVPMESDEYVQIIDNVIRNGEYTIHPFSTVDNALGIELVAALAGFDVEPVDLYVNPAFYNYLTDTDYQ